MEAKAFTACTRAGFLHKSEPLSTSIKRNAKNTH